MREDRYPEIEAEWRKKIAEFTPKAEVDYSWVWEYAKFRFEWVTERLQYVEEKAMRLLTLVLTIAAGAWAVFAYLESRGIMMPVAGYYLVILALALLLISAILALLAIRPIPHRHPASEDDALKSAEFYPYQSGAIGWFSLWLGMCSQVEMRIITRKGHLLIAGLVTTSMAAACFITAVFWAVLLRM